MLFGLFENYTSTDQGKSRRKLFPPIEVKKTSVSTYKILIEAIEKHGFYDITTNDDYLEIFALKDGFELSLQVVRNDAQSFIIMSVYGEKKRGKTRAFFKTYYETFKDLFA